MGLRVLNRRRLRAENRGNRESQRLATGELVAFLRTSPIAVETRKANEQHYEVPSSFFRQVLGKRMKYSGCYWPDGVETLDGAEEAVLDLTRRRAQIENGMEILDLGCGWGSLSLTKTRPKSSRSSRGCTVRARHPFGFAGGACSSLPVRNCGGQETGRNGSFPTTGSGPES